MRNITIVFTSTRYCPGSGELPVSLVYPEYVGTALNRFHWKKVEALVSIQPSAH